MLASTNTKTIFAVTTASFNTYHLLDPIPKTQLLTTYVNAIEFAEEMTRLEKELIDCDVGINKCRQDFYYHNHEALFKLYVGEDLSYVCSVTKHEVIV